MPAPRIVQASEVPDNRGRREASSAQQLVDRWVAESADRLAQLTRGESMLFEFTVEDDAGFSFTGASVAHLKDRCRRMFRTAMKAGLPKELDARLTTTYDIPVRQESTKEFSVSGFRAFVEPA